MRLRRVALMMLGIVGPAVTACASVCEQPRAMAKTIKSGDRQTVIGCLSHEASWVREEAALQLGAAQQADVAAALQRMLLDKSEPAYVRAAAARSLGRLAAPSAFDAMTGVLADSGGQPELEIAIIESLCAFPKRKNDALQSIANMRDNEDIVVSAAAEKKVRTKCGGR